jgi:sarcosine oxidase
LTTHFDVAVIGCGAMGSSVSYNLSKRGLKVLTLEQFGLNHGLGSSHGKTRIIRLAYYEDPRYVPLLRRAFEAWREVEAESGRSLLRMTGGLMIGRHDGGLVSGVLRSARVHQIPHRLMSASEVKAKFKAFSLGDSLSAVYEESAGILFPEECVRAFAELAGQSGADLRFSEPVTNWELARDKVEIETTKGSYYADRIVLCTGAWMGRLLGGLVPLEIERQVLFWFSSEGQRIFAAGHMPVFILEESRDALFYGVPDVGHGVKIARTHGGRAVEPDGVGREVSAEDLRPVEAFMERRVPKLNRKPLDSATCLYTNTPDLNFAVGLHPQDSRVVVVSACSGHGFKFASVLGEVVTDLAVEGRTSFDVSFIGLERFGRGRQGASR